MKAQWMRQHTLDRGGPQRGVSSSQNPGVAGMGERSSMVRRDRADRIRQSSSQIGEARGPGFCVVDLAAWEVGRWSSGWVDDLLHVHAPLDLGWGHAPTLFPHPSP